MEERTGSKFCPLDRGICWPGPRKARWGVGLGIASLFPFWCEAEVAGTPCWKEGCDEATRSVILD